MRSLPSIVIVLARGQRQGPWLPQAARCPAASWRDLL